MNRHFFLVLSTIVLAGSAVAANPESRLGAKVEDFTLDNSYGKAVSLKDFADRELVVVAFLGTECPLAKLYGPRLSEIQTEFADKGVAVIGVNSNTQDNLTELAAYGRRHEISFPLLKDVGSRIADAMKAERTPEVFLLDRDRIVRYHGRIDDQYGVGYSKERGVKSELATAIKELLAGDPIAVPETKAVGCHIGRVKRLEPVGDITYTKHIAPIFNAHCVRCHREKEIAPFTLSSYDDVLGWEDTILEVIEDNRMPPWFANPDHGEFANDPRLSGRERELIEEWVDNGMPEGDLADLPEPPQFTDGWQIPEPDQVINMNSDDTAFAVPAEGGVDYKRFVVDPQWREDKYIIAAEARPGNRAVVHHIVVYVIPPGGRRSNLEQMLVGYAPGGMPIELPKGVAMKIAAGSKLEFELHYTPNGYEQTDLSYIGVRFTDKGSVKKELRGRIGADGGFKIPPGVANHEVVASPVSIHEDEWLLSLTPHMHLRGKSFQYLARYPDGTDEILLDVPHYDFNWQLKYVPKVPKKLPAGTEVVCTAVYDNSEANLTNPDPSKTVHWGDQSDEEMMIGFMSTIPVDD